MKQNLNKALIHDENLKIFYKKWLVILTLFSIFDSIKNLIRFSNNYIINFKRLLIILQNFVYKMNDSIELKNKTNFNERRFIDFKKYTIL